MASNFYEKVFFLGIARMAGQGIVVASYSYNTDTDLSGVKQVLEQPNMNMSPGKHYSFSVGQMAWHLIAGDAFHLLSTDLRLTPCPCLPADDLGLIYILICELNYPQRTAHACLEELQRTVIE